MTSNAVTENVWTPAWIQRITRGQWLSPPLDANQPLAGLGIDSRDVKPGQAFLALKGDQFDGHQFVDKAIKSGAILAIIDQDHGKESCADAGVLQVDNTINALHRLADAYRDALRAAGCHIIAVVGSNGKTTTRHLIHAVLSTTLKGTQSPKSFNNHLGVPLTLLGASLEDDFLVAEVGTNHPGEIDALGELLEPDSVVITCIGKEHMEFFGDLEGVANEEAAITRHLSSRGKVFIESEAYQWVRNASSFNPSSDVMVYGGSDTQTAQDQSHQGRQSIRIGGTTIDLPLIAPHDRINAMAAAEVGRAMGVQDAQIKSALESVAPMPSRLEVKQLDRITLIDDSYNANPDSTLAALEALASYSRANNGRRIAVLGDMLELGDIAEASHREVGHALTTLFNAGALDGAVLIGPLMAWTLDELQSSHHVDKIKHYPEYAESTQMGTADLIQPDDVVLLKGSRGMQLERLLPALQTRFNDQTPG